MARRAERSDAAASPSGGELDALMQTEERLRVAQAACEAEVERIRLDARRAAEAARRDRELELVHARKALEERVTAERDAELGRVTQEHRAEKAALEGITDAQVEELAAVLIRRLLGHEAAPAGPEGLVT